MGCEIYANTDLLIIHIYINMISDCQLPNSVNGEETLANAPVVIFDTPDIGEDSKNDQIEKKSWNTPEIEDLVKIWGEKANGNHILHSFECSIWRKFSNRFHMSVIVMSATSGILSVSETIFDGSIFIFSALSICIGCFTGILKFYKPDERTQIHKELSNKYSKLYRDILLELSMNRSNRSNAEDFTKRIMNKLNDLQRESPNVSDSTIQWFIKNAKNQHLDPRKLPDTINLFSQPITVNTADIV